MTAHGFPGKNAWVNLHTNGCSFMYICMALAMYVTRLVHENIPTTGFKAGQYISILNT